MKISAFLIGWIFIASIAILLLIPIVNIFVSIGLWFASSYVLFYIIPASWLAACINYTFNHFGIRFLSGIIVGILAITLVISANAPTRKYRYLNALGLWIAFTAEVLIAFYQVSKLSDL